MSSMPRVDPYKTQTVPVELPVGPFDKRALRAACAAYCANYGTHESHTRDALAAAVGALDREAIIARAIAWEVAHPGNPRDVEPIHSEAWWGEALTALGLFP